MEACDTTLQVKCLWYIVILEWLIPICLN